MASFVTLVIVAWIVSVCARSGNDDVHIAFLTDCTLYSDWQTVGMAFSYRESKQVGAITRVMCCTDDERKRYHTQLLEIMPTHIAPSFAYNERTKDHYAAYNKPGAVVDWLQHVTPEEDWILVLDSDMYLRKPLVPSAYNLQKGWCISADYTYMIGCNNELAVRHIPQIAPRNDTLAGPAGRLADQVGGFFFMHRDDLQRVAPLWLSTTEEVREDPEAWRLAGDQYVKGPGDKPWISEMYGYAFAAAKSNVWHRWDLVTMTYPKYLLRGIPKLIHYGLLFEVNEYKFDKHWHYDLDVTVCPPWDLKDFKKRPGGIFPHAPRPSELQSTPFYKYYINLVAIETVAILNAALCDFHVKHCPPSEQLTEVCDAAVERYNEVKRAVADAEVTVACTDFQESCGNWAANGQCDSNLDYMTTNCRKSCKKCEPSPVSDSSQTTAVMPSTIPALATAQTTSSQVTADQSAGSGVVQATPLDQQTIPSTVQATTPGVQATVPVVSASTTVDPIVQATTPVVQETIPATQTTVLVVDTATPLVQTVTPVLQGSAQTSTPMVQTTVDNSAVATSSPALDGTPAVQTPAQSTTTDLPQPTEVQAVPHVLVKQDNAPDQGDVAPNPVVNTAPKPVTQVTNGVVTAVKLDAEELREKVIAQMKVAQTTQNKRTTFRGQTRSGSRYDPELDQEKRVLVNRCYRMALSMSQVSTCLKLAYEGKPYDMASSARSVLQVESEGLQGVVVTPEAKLKLGNSEGTKVPVHAPADTPKHGLSLLAEQLTSQNILMFCSLIVVAAYFLPKLIRRRRARSGLRSE